jgi:chromosome segregation ATPase
MRWQKTLEQLEYKLKIQETNLTDLTRHNANMQKTIVTFVKNEKQLVADLNQVKVDTRAKDQKIAELELNLHEINIKNEELVKENEDVNDKNTHLIRKFNY